MIAGANDVHSGESLVSLKNLKPCLQSLGPARILLATIPFRKDIPFCHPINKQIILINMFISDVAHSTKNVQLIDFSGFSDRCYARSGVHLNRNGKKIIMLLSSKQTTTFPIHTLNHI